MGETKKPSDNEREIHVLKPPDGDKIIFGVWGRRGEILGEKRRKRAAEELFVSPKT